MLIDKKKFMEQFSDPPLWDRIGIHKRIKRECEYRGNKLDL